MDDVEAWLRHVAASPLDARFILAGPTYTAVRDFALHLSRLAPDHAVVLRHPVDAATLFGRRAFLVSAERPEKVVGLAEAHGVYLLAGVSSYWFVKQLEVRLAPGGRLFGPETP